MSSPVMSMFKSLSYEKPKEDESNQTAILVGINADKKVALSIVNKDGMVLLTQTMSWEYAEHIRDMLEVCINNTKTFENEEPPENSRECI